MRYLFLLLILAGCAMTLRPVDILGPGIYCQPLSEYVQRCYDRYQKPWICIDQGGRWDCEPEYPMHWGYTKW